MKINEKCCLKEINIEINKTGLIEKLETKGGCQANLRLISELLKGKYVCEVYDMMKDIMCGRRGTSCSAEIAKMIKEQADKQGISINACNWK